MAGKSTLSDYIAYLTETEVFRESCFCSLPLPANNDILLQFPYTKLTCVRIIPLVNVLVLLGDELLAVILADVNTNLYLPTPESKLQLIGY